jgi:hypothetical protein
MQAEVSRSGKAAELFGLTCAGCKVNQCCIPCSGRKDRRGVASQDSFPIEESFRLFHAH